MYTNSKPKLMKKCSTHFLEQYKNQITNVEWRGSEKKGNVIMWQWLWLFIIMFPLVNTISLAPTLKDTQHFVFPPPATFLLFGLDRLISFLVWSGWMDERQDSKVTKIYGLYWILNTDCCLNYCGKSRKWFDTWYTVIIIEMAHVLGGANWKKCSKHGTACENRKTW